MEFQLAASLSSSWSSLLVFFLQYTSIVASCLPQKNNDLDYEKNPPARKQHTDLGKLSLLLLFSIRTVWDARGSDDDKTFVTLWYITVRGLEVNYYVVMKW